MFEYIRIVNNHVPDRILAKMLYCILLSLQILVIWQNRNKSAITELMFFDTYSFSVCLVPRSSFLNKESSSHKHFDEFCFSKLYYIKLP